MKNVPKDLDAISDVVLRYKPAPKSKASKRRARDESANAMQGNANCTHVYN